STQFHPLTPEQQELADLKQENYQLKMKVAILEKLKALVDQRTEKNKRQ
ncbi:transposase, partial [Leuconostoc pseudomesenteroides]